MISRAALTSWLLRIAVRRMPAARAEWGAAMLAELAQLQHPRARWQFALSCLRVALFPPRRRKVLQTFMNNQTKSLASSLRSASSIGLLLVLPFMLLDFTFVIVKRLDTFSLRNTLDFIALFGFLWLGLTAIVLVLMPLARGFPRAGNKFVATPVLARGSRLKHIITNPRSAALIGAILALPFATILGLLVFHIEPPLGPLASLLSNPNPDQPDVLGSLIVVGSFLLAVLACLIVRAPIVRTLGAGGSLFAHPVNLLLAVVILSVLVMLVASLIVDQFPCWIGTPNCD